jgi:lysophospholipase L1-like esterase
LSLVGTTVAAQDDKAGTSYVATGDSLAAGVGSSDPGTLAYVPLTQQHLMGLLGKPRLGLINLGISGETSSTFITDGQLDAAVEVLGARNGDENPNNDVAAVTLNIGGNDAIGLFLYWFGNCAGQVPRPPVCQFAFNYVLYTFEQNLGVILAALRSAAGPDTPIAVATNYNPLVQPLCYFYFPVAIDTVNVILEGGTEFGGIVVPEDGGFNDLTRRVAAEHDVIVADLVPGGEFPALLGAKDIQPDCAHANDDGHELMADTFKDAVKDLWLAEP